MIDQGRILQAQNNASVLHMLWAELLVVPSILYIAD